MRLTMPVAFILYLLLIFLCAGISIRNLQLAMRAGGFGRIVQAAPEAFSLHDPHPETCARRSGWPSGWFKYTCCRGQLLTNGNAAIASDMHSKVTLGMTTYIASNILHAFAKHDKLSTAFMGGSIREKLM